MTLLAVDFGTRRLGIAVTDSAEKMALSVGTFPVRSGAEAVETVANLAGERGVSGIYVGIPIGIAGGPTKMSERVHAFVEKLCGRVTVPVMMADERFTTKRAEEPMIAAGMSGRKRRGRVDAGAAVVLLQSVLATRRPGS